MRHATVNVLTSAGGAYSETLLTSQEAEFYGVRVLDNDLTNTADITFTDTVTGEVLLTITNLAATKSYYPRALAQDQAGADLTGWYVPIPTSGLITVAVAQGGNAKHATILIFLA
jgi:hypothetical protein